MTWTDFQGNSGQGVALAYTADSGFFYFFQPEILELLVKVVNGCGFNDSMHSHIFQMFGRANPDAAIAGDGIGLALCQRIVQAHGGRIWAESVPGEGSTFYVRLPRRMTGSNFGDL